MILLANETTADATLTPNSVDINYPVSNILDSRLSRIFKTDSSTTCTIVFDAGSAVTVTAVAIANHNISSGVTTLKIQGNATDAWGAPSVDETLTHSSGVITKTFTGGSYRYWRLHIVDAGNSGGYISLGRVGLYNRFATPDISPVIGHSRNSQSVKSISVSGQSYMDTRYFNSSISVKFPAMTATEKANLITQFETIDIGEPFFVTFDESNISLGTVYCTIDQNSINFNLLANPEYWEGAISFMEEV